MKLSKSVKRLIALLVAALIAFGFTLGPHLFRSVSADKKAGNESSEQKTLSESKAGEFPGTAQAAIDKASMDGASGLIILDPDSPVFPNNPSQDSSSIIDRSTPDSSTPDSGDGADEHREPTEEPSDPDNGAGTGDGDSANLDDDTMNPDDVTPSVTPEITPDITPEITPDITPETTPEVTPEIPDMTSYTIDDQDIFLSVSDVNRFAEVFDKPYESSEMIHELALGSRVHVTGVCIENGWYRISFTAKGITQTGFMRPENLRENPRQVSATPTPSPIPTNTPTPKPTNTPTPKPTNTPTPKPTNTPTPKPTNTPTPKPTNTPTPKPTNTPTPKPTNTPTPKPTNTPTPKPTNTPTPTPTPKPTSTPTPTDTPTPTPTPTVFLTNAPTPTAVPKPSDTPEGSPTPSAEPGKADKPGTTVTPTSTPYKIEEMDKKMYINAQEVNVRSTPETTSDNRNKVTTIREFGKEFHVTGKTTYKGNTWYRVDYEGEDAYIHSNYLSNSVKQEHDAIYDLFVVSAKHKNLPYRANNTWDSADCCGFIQVLYKEVLGIDLGRSVADQMSYGKQISWDEARPGDLVATKNDPYTHGNHVGIYLGYVDGHYWYLSQSKYHVHLGYMEGSCRGTKYRDVYVPIRVTDKTTSKTAKQIFDMLIEAGVKKNNF